jgi:hypothetical protein
MQVAGQLPDYSTLGSIEHVLPQTLDELWRQYLGDDADHKELRTVVDTVGNLCLLSQPANSKVGQDPFEEKKASPEYTEVSALVKSIKSYTGKWNIAAIRQRSETLADRAVRIWAW